MFLFAFNTENIIWINGKKGAAFDESNKAMSGSTGHIHSQVGSQFLLKIAAKAVVRHWELQQVSQRYVDESRVISEYLETEVSLSFPAVRQLHWYIQDSARLSNSFHGSLAVCCPYLQCGT